MRRVGFVFLLGAHILMGFGCATNLRDEFIKYDQATMERADFCPTPDELEAARMNKVKAVVVPPESKKAIVERADLSRVFVSNIEVLLNDAGVDVITPDTIRSMKIMERQYNIPTKSSRERGKSSSIKSNDTPYSGSMDANYAIICLIDTLGFSSQFEPERRNDEGKVISEAQCNYYGSFKGRIKIHEIHARKTIETISISDSSSAYRLSNNPQCSISRNLKYALAKKALAYSVHSSRNRLKNFFSSIGYIVDKRIKDDESIFEITLGKFHNINKGDIVDIYTKTEKEKSLENEIVIREIKVAQGKVTDYIEDSYSWIIVPDQEQASRVRLGDYVKIRYKQSIWDSTKQMFN